MAARSSLSMRARWVPAVCSMWENSARARAAGSPRSRPWRRMKRSSVSMTLRLPDGDVEQRARADAVVDDEAAVEAAEHVVEPRRHARRLALPRGWRAAAEVGGAGGDLGHGLEGALERCRQRCDLVHVVGAARLLEIAGDDDAAERVSHEVDLGLGRAAPTRGIVVAQQLGALDHLLDEAGELGLGRHQRLAPVVLEGVDGDGLVLAGAQAVAQLLDQLLVADLVDLIRNHAGGLDRLELQVVGVERRALEVAGQRRPHGLVRQPVLVLERRAEPARHEDGGMRKRGHGDHDPLLQCVAANRAEPGSNAFQNAKHDPVIVRDRACVKAAA